MKQGYAVVAACCVGLVSIANAESRSLSSTMAVYVFPTEGQDASQQSKDEAECYEWAVGNAGVDPFELTEQKESDQKQAQRGRVPVQEVPCAAPSRAP